MCLNLYGQHYLANVPCNKFVCKLHRITAGETIQMLQEEEPTPTSCHMRLEWNDGADSSYANRSTILRVKLRENVARTPESQNARVTRGNLLLLMHLHLAACPTLQYGQITYNFNYIHRNYWRVTSRIERMSHARSLLVQRVSPGYRKDRLTWHRLCISSLLTWIKSTQTLSSEPPAT